MYAFLDRTGSAFFAPVRDLIESWVAALPSATDRNEVTGQLTSRDDDAFDSAFWELYLYKVTTATGHDVEVHPCVPGTTKRPDFLVHGPEPYYLEATSVGMDPEVRARKRRLAELEAVLDETRLDGLTLSADFHVVGKTPIKATRLRNQLLRWAAGIDRSLLLAQFQAGLGSKDLLPTYAFNEDGWHLTFAALPTGKTDGPLVGLRGTGRAVGVDNKPGLRRRLDDKANRYGTALEYPLVTAVLANTEFPTRDYDIQPVLFGDHAFPPRQVTDASDLFEDGHWRTRSGWRRSHNPAVITAVNLSWRSLARVVPRLWSTAEPGVRSVAPLPWADSVDVSGPEPSAPVATPALASLGVDRDWCAGIPDFDEGRGEVD
jgi:hypothetical protein